MNAAIKLLLMQLDTAFDKRSWHGPNLMGAIRGLSPELALVAPSGRKTPWHQLLHAAYWKYSILRKIAPQTEPFPRRPSNWPNPPLRPDRAQWTADLQLLKDIHAKLREAVSKLQPRELSDRTVWLIQGAAAHDLYHAGQIRLLRRFAPSRR
jgi:hypothetical protein